jgi:hypothetical protein
MQLQIGVVRITVPYPHSTMGRHLPPTAGSVALGIQPAVGLKR